MENQTNYKNKFLKLLPKKATAISFFQTAPFSPGRDHHKTRQELHNNNNNKSHAVSLIPVEVRRKTKSKNDGYIEIQEEPTSPKVSCMGQIKKKKKKKLITTTKPKTESVNKKTESLKKKQAVSAIQRIFSSVNPKHKQKQERETETETETETEVIETKGSLGPSSLNQMKRFASGREAFKSFDWTTAMAEASPEENLRNYYSDDEIKIDKKKVNLVAFSAPLILNSDWTDGGGDGDGFVLKPKKEINLWKRRTMDPPKPLEVLK